MAALDLAYAMTLPPQEAMAYLRQKGYAVSWDWWDVWQQEHVHAFTVAKLTRLDLLETVRRAVQQALDEGKTGRWFRDQLQPLLVAQGWWGRTEDIDQETGEVRTVQLGSPWRLATIFTTNIQTAYMSGRYAQQMANLDDRPYWQYVAVMDARTRPSHAAMNGMVFRADDPFWASFYPPNGWRCRCRVRALTAEQAGDRVQSSAGRLGSVQVPVSPRRPDITRPVATYTLPGPVPGRERIVSPDVGWSYNPGQAHYQPSPDQYGGDLRRLAQREL